MNGFQRRYAILQGTWKAGYRTEVSRSAIAFLILVLLSGGVCLVLPDLRTTLVERVVALLGGLGVTDAAGNLSAAALFSNNVRACVFIMLYGLVPFVQLPALAVGMNAMLVGVLGAQYIADGAGWVYLAAILPHGIFEIPALILSFAMGLYVCGQMTRRCRRDETALPIWECLAQMSWLLLLVLVPLLAAAAIVETYVTPLLLSLFL